MEERAVFEPGRYITKVNGGDYLEVKWRLVWFRNEHPNAAISTELVHHDGVTAIFKARVSVPDGGSATGWGSETTDDFRDYIEKAETKALGRALAALGFGTQFCPDFDFGAAQDRVVDAPIDMTAVRGRRRQPSGQAQPATERQIKFLHSIARGAGLSDEALDKEARELYGRPVAQLGKSDASALIERLQSRQATTGDDAS